MVLLRKKKRSKKRRSGGGRTTNPNYKGKVQKRQPKNQYVHFKGIVLSTGEPNKWYVPKCIAVADEKMDGKLIGKEMPTLCQSIIFEVNDGVYRVQNTRKHCSHKGGVRNTNAEVYAKIGLQFAATAKNSKNSGGEMVAMKYRLWWCTPATRVPPYTLRGFSVE